MSRVTGKFQITIPKRLVDAYGIRVGDEVHLVAAGDAISIVLAGDTKVALSQEEKLRAFDEETRRLAARKREHLPTDAKDRGWTREELYTRGRPR